MRINEVESQPYSKLDLPNKVYIVYDENGNEVNRHPFKEVWDSSPARNAAQKDVNDMKIALRKSKAEGDARNAEAKPLSKFEQEYMDIHSKWQRYYDAMFSKDPNRRLTDIDNETKQIYTDQMDKWMKRMEQLAQVVRKSIMNGTYKPPAQ